MPPPSFTWTVVPPNHLIRSVCNTCARLVAVSGRGDLLHAIERVHQCVHANQPKAPAHEAAPLSDAKRA